MRRKCIIKPPLFDTIVEEWAWPYEEALSWMQQARAACQESGHSQLAMGSHRHSVVTLGRHASEREILDAAMLERLGVAVHRIDRGGGATLHGPGQIVVYPVFSLTTTQLSVPQFVCALEQAIIDTLQSFAIDASRHCGEPGVFVGDAKIGSVGLHLSKGVVTHGVSLNVANDLSLYKLITPCSKANALITSMRALLAKEVDVPLVGRLLAKQLSLAIHSELVPKSPSCERVFQ